ncbi:MAG TPA: protoporphyrinogen oxidase [Drouetiella sp.]
MDIVVIGAGISGLASAHSLLKRFPSANLQVLEASGHCGGIISTLYEDGCIVEEGPDSFLSTKPWAVQLCNDLNLGGQIIQTNESNRKALVASSGEILPLPEGFFLLAPTKIWPFIDSKVLSLSGKLSAACEIFREKNVRVREETIKQFVTRRFGQELFDRIAQPMVGGIYTGDPDKLSAQATLPQFVEMERKYGSVIKGLMRERGKLTADSGARYSAFVSLRNGMQELVDSLVRSIGSERIITNCPVSRLEKSGSTWSVQTAEGKTIRADSVVLAVPAPALAKLLSGIDDELSTELKTVEYSSCAVLNLLFDESDITKPINGFGFVVPEIERKSLLACSFSSNKFVGRVPAGKVLMRAFMGGALHPDVFELSDGDLVRQTLTDLNAYLGITTYPQRVWIKRWGKSMPQYHIGHVDLVERIKSRFANLDGLVWAGSALQGVGIPDCVRSGIEAAQAVSASTLVYS